MRCCNDGDGPVDALRTAVAVLIIVAYIASMIAGVLIEGYHYPPGLAIAVWFAAAFLLYSPATKKLSNLKSLSIQIKPPEAPDEPGPREPAADES